MTIQRMSAPMGAATTETIFGTLAKKVAFLPVSVLSAGMGTILIWQERARQRYRIAELDDRALKDIGVSRAELHREWRKPFWVA